MQTTRLRIFCDYVIEAGWLAAVITVPLFFNVFSSRVFEPDKLTLLRSIALFMALAWLVKFLDGGFNTGEAQSPPAASLIRHWLTTIRTTPLLLPTLLLVIVYLISTLFSIAPRISFWGSYQRLQGTYTTLSYILVFTMVLQGLRTRAQLDRLITAIILASLPVALYGLIQHYGLDPLPWLGDVQKRVASTMGNAIFVAAYLIMVVPLTLLRLLEGFADLVQTEDNIAPPFIQATGYLFIFMAQLLAILFSQSRGPLLGLFSALFVFGLLWAVTRQDRRLVTGIVGIALAGFLFLIAMNLPNTPLSPLKKTPYIGRLGYILETQKGSGKVRVLIWEGATRLITSDPVRTLIGYGPETMHVAYNPFYPPELAHYEARNASPDRAHNETFDALVITGLAGFLAYLFLFISLFYYTLKWLGLVSTRTQQFLLPSLIIAGGLLTAGGFYIVDGSGRFFGVALPAGMIVGLFAYLIWVTLFDRHHNVVTHPYSMALIALLAAVIGHFVEIHFGIAIAATRTLFWVYTAVMVVLGYLVQQRPELLDEPHPSMVANAPMSGRSHRRGKRRPGLDTTSAGWPWRAAVPVAGIGTIILLTLAYDFFTNPGRETSALSAVWHALFYKWERGQFVTSPATLWLIGLVWILIGFLGLASAARMQSPGRQGAPQPPEASWWLRGWAIYAAITLTAFLFFSLLITGRLTPQPAGTTLDQALEHMANHITVYYVLLFSTLILLAMALAGTSSPPPERWWQGRWPVLASPILAILVVLVIGKTNLNVVKADIIYKQAWNGYHVRGEYDAAIATYQRALELQPHEDYYYLFLGKAYLEKAQSVKDEVQRDQLYQASRQALLQAQRLNPLNPDHAANLARLHQQWGRMTQDPERKRELLETALEYHQQAIALAPNSAHLYNEWALTLDQMERFEEAIEVLQKSLEIDPEFADTYVFLGEVYRHKGDVEPAIQAYQKAAEVDPKRADAHRGLALLYAFEGRIEEARQEAEQVAQLAGQDPTTYLILGDIFRSQGQLQEAIEMYQSALQINPQAVEAYNGLVLAYEAEGNLDAALTVAQNALQLAPENQQLQALVQSLESRLQ